MREKLEPVEVCCPRCGRTQIVYLPEEKPPVCPEDRLVMVVRDPVGDGRSR